MADVNSIRVRGFTALVVTRRQERAEWHGLGITRKVLHTIDRFFASYSSPFVRACVRRRWFWPVDSLDWVPTWSGWLGGPLSRGRRAQLLNKLRAGGRVWPQGEGVSSGPAPIANSNSGSSSNSRSSSSSRSSSFRSSSRELQLHSTADLWVCRADVMKSKRGRDFGWLDIGMPRCLNSALVPSAPIP